MRILTLALIALTAALLWGGCGELPERKVYRSGTDFFPLLEGRKLRYRESADGETREYTMTFRYIGGREWKVYEVKGDDLPYGAIEFQSDGRIVEAVTMLSMTSLESRLHTGQFNQVWLDDGVSEDSAWQDFAPGTETLVAGFETVTVPAGRYEECLMTVTTPLPEVKDSVEARYNRDEMKEPAYLRERELANWQTMRWFAHGVGLVKEQIGPPGEIRIVRELLAIEEEGYGLVDSLQLRKTQSLQDE